MLMMNGYEHSRPARFVAAVDLAMRVAASGAANVLGCPTKQQVGTRTGGHTNARKMGNSCEPWMTRGSIEALGHLLEPHHTGLEWSTGSGSIWMLRRLGSLYSIEHQGTWLAHVRSAVSTIWRNSTQASRAAWVPVHAPCRKVQPNGCRGNDPASAIDDYTGYRMAARRPNATFDHVLVDGRDRVACLKEALRPPSLIASPHGLLTLDNAERPRYAPAIAAVPAGWLCFSFKNDLDETIVWMACSSDELA